ncbi:hypothetical protein JKP88DRAFT_204039 [Tribonema minus]|uniref:Fe2OG dioxygenase domain-containing protein n=1 Tax=Tribonema minus TaxID=303371 RepID=A0A835ZDT2_9STRA|nr:hypothetical protein JKP88DRAFT_204039 [Tribonema minus]
MPVSVPTVDLQSHRTGTIPSVYYNPDFVTASLADEIIKQVYAVPEGHARWTVLRTRRLQCWGGQLQADGRAHDPSDLCPWLQQLCTLLVTCGIFPAHAPPNHVLINEYQPGQGIMPHTDGPMYYPRTATLSLMSDAVFKLAQRPRSPGDIGSVDLSPTEALLLRNRSLVVFADAAYTDFTHGIDFVHEEAVGDGSGGTCSVVNGPEAGVAEEEVVVERALRISLTFRHVPDAARTGQQQMPAPHT